jgi:hypothetical protein
MWINMRRFPTPIENIVLNAVFHLMDEERFDRTHEEYEQIKKRLPPLKVLHGKINDMLSKIAAEGTAPYEICRFKAGDKRYRYEPFPTSVSLETVRTALDVGGMRKQRGRRRSRA